VDDSEALAPTRSPTDSSFGDREEFLDPAGEALDFDSSPLSAAPGAWLSSTGMASGTPGGSVVSSFDSSLSVILNKKEKMGKKKAIIYEIPTEVSDKEDLWTQMLIFSRVNNGGKREKAVIFGLGEDFQYLLAGSF